MKKFYTFWIFVMAMLGASLQASANITCDLSWEYPGSVKIYVGGTAESNRVDVPADATSYHVDYEKSFGTVYVKPNAGYFVNSATCNDSNHAEPAVMNFSSWVGGVSINLNNSTTLHDGHSIWVDVVKLVNDKEITVNVVSDGDVRAKFTETGREVSLNYGTQTIEYASSHEKTMTFYNNNNNLYNSETNPKGYELDGEGNPIYYLKQKAEGETEWTDLQWRLQFSNWKHNTATLVGNDEFEVKVNSAIPAVVDPVPTYTVTLDADATAMSALSMVFNVTKMKSISNYTSGSFEVEENDVVRFAFNTADYTVTVNGTTLTPSSGNSTTWVCDPVTENTTITFSVAERVYPDVEVTIAVNDPSHLVVHNGTIDGPIIDLTTLTPNSTGNSFAGSNFSGYTYNVYTVPVNGKYGKAFVEPADGWVLLESVTGAGGQDLQETQAASTTSGTLHVLVHHIERTSTFWLKIALGNDASPSNMVIKNSFRDIVVDTSTLNEGLNTINFDPVWDKELNISILGIQDTEFKLFREYAQVTLDSQALCYKPEAAVDCLMHAFIKTTPPGVNSYEFTFDTYKDMFAPTVRYDDVKSFTPSQYVKTFKTFATYPLTISLAKYTTVTGYEEQVEDGVLTISPAYNNSGYISLPIKTVPTSQSVAVYHYPKPDDNSKVVFEVFFPDAETVEIARDKEETIAVLEEESEEPGRFYETAKAGDIEVLEGKSCPAFKITFPMPEGLMAASYRSYAYSTAVTSTETYKFSLVPAGFEINGYQQAPETSLTAINDLTSGIDLNRVDDNDKVTVVSIDGRVVMMNADRENLNSLAPGVYIVNGKKVFKR